MFLICSPDIVSVVDFWLVCAAHLLHPPRSLFHMFLLFVHVKRIFVICLNWPNNRGHTNCKALQGNFDFGIILQNK